MASIASSSSHHRLYLRTRRTQPVADRIFRALRHHLKLLHRSESNFFILGATGNVYTVTLTTNPACTCPDRTTPCKHILFVLIRVLGVSLNDTCLRRRTLRPCRVSHLLSTPTSGEALASEGVRQRFHELFFQVKKDSLLRPNNNNNNNNNMKIEDGTTCPICLDEIEKDGVDQRGAVACGTCKNVIHEECLKMWRKSRGRRGGNCVICRARWRDHRNDQERYLNLSAYVSDDGYHTGIDGAGLCAG
ncbi:mitogen-activated protein kinase kinase kinase 1 [Ricinus communis]|uniref:Uncharacterized protein n=1 Tax=Ricinus communis TaxID=3988 RepID=B9RRY9_RICCO|nr:mitogen-activated protein kinase kinase kinase 1 [Ricinus communis]EEF45849.1 conserved hypothetical protein [Ricinus communis]|eukprot:XP_002516508.1 mitogen-activated protein kinase kinase kinase 1 [Ricinus communis]